jgi:signal transduction histidine kinase
MKEYRKQPFHSFDNFYYKEVASLTGAGGWSIDFKNKKSYLDPEARTILALPKEYQPSLFKLVDFYVEGEHRDKAVEVFLACCDGTPFKTVVKMQDFNNKEFWVKATGGPRYNNKEEIVGIHGVFIDVNEEKIKELALEESFKVIDQQNKRLQNFAHIVSHNLRSHTGNLQLTLELLGLSGNDGITDNEELLSGLTVISENLNHTISDLNEVVAINNVNPDTAKIVKFQDVYERVSHTLKNDIIAADADIFVDFTEFPEVKHIRSYLESIMQNLISNALKYKHPDRNPYIQICTYLNDDEKGCLLIKDNGVGIDLEVFGDRVFNMYQTFHNNSNATGVGLYMTRNQIETLGGTIEIDSVVGKYTSFIIQF